MSVSPIMVFNMVNRSPCLNALRVQPNNLVLHPLHLALVTPDIGVVHGMNVGMLDAVQIQVLRSMNVEMRTHLELRDHEREVHDGHDGGNVRLAVEVAMFIVEMSAAAQFSVWMAWVA